MANNIKPQENIFTKTRLKFGELWTDTTNYLKSQYAKRGQIFSDASPFYQIIRVILHMSRMIFFYIEDSISELNILTANRPDSIKGIATLTGYDAFRGISARGNIRLTIRNKDGKADGVGNIVIPNNMRLLSSITGLHYTMILPTESIILNSKSNPSVIVPLYQGVFESQSVTGSGRPMQSYNFKLNKSELIDHFMTDLYVNGVRWKQVNSLYDMPYDSQTYILKTGLNGGIDVFFGDGKYGQIPNQGASIRLNYFTHYGNNGNIKRDEANNLNSWKIMSDGRTVEGTYVDLNDYIDIEMVSDISMGTFSEESVTTRLAAPMTSRSFVLANEANYETFLRKLNIFSIIDIIKGNNSFEDQQIRVKYDALRVDYSTKKEVYLKNVADYGVDNEQTKKSKEEMNKSLNRLKSAELEIQNTSMDDNTVYLFLVPNVESRMGENENYFTCSPNAFEFTPAEQFSILDLIESSGQKILTVENRILKPLYPKFSINIDVIRWEGYDETTIYNNIINNLSKYFIDLTRRDRIPVSDIIKIVEDIDGVDSVKASFDADENNMNIFKTHYGIEETSGDIVLSRDITTSNGSKILVRDAYPLFRGGFKSKNGLAYSALQNEKGLSAVNVNFVGITSKNGTNVYTGSMVKR